MKKIFFAFVLLSLLGKVEAKFVDESVFPQWAENAIERMSEAKIMTGLMFMVLAPCLREWFILAI